MLTFADNRIQQYILDVLRLKKSQRCLVVGWFPISGLRFEVLLCELRKNSWRIDVLTRVIREILGSNSNSHQKRSYIT
jgi:hypothetical protein